MVHILESFSLPVARLVCKLSIKGVSCFSINILIHPQTLPASSPRQAHISSLGPEPHWSWTLVPNSLHLIPRTHVTQGENQLLQVILCLHMSAVTYTIINQLVD